MIIRPQLCFTALALSVGLGACSTARESLAEPELRPIENPADMVGRMPLGIPTPPPPTASGAPNSLWQVGAKSFFDDQRANEIGDILTVEIAITDSANVRNTTATSRTGTEDASVTGLFGLTSPIERVLPGANSLDPAVGLSSASATNGTGSVNRAETINLTVAAVITDVLPNGNFVIAGRQEVKVNAEVRELLISGLIRPQDISADNMVKHTQIAEARISYSGRGDLSRMQRPRYGQRVADSVLPF